MHQKHYALLINTFRTLPLTAHACQQQQCFPKQLNQTYRKVYFTFFFRRFSFIQINKQIFDKHHSCSIVCVCSNFLFRVSYQLDILLLKIALSLIKPVYALKVTNTLLLRKIVSFYMQQTRNGCIRRFKNSFMKGNVIDLDLISELINFKCEMDTLYLW